MVSRYIYLLRHGNYQTEKSSTEYGKLTQLGIRQAAFAAKHLSELKIGKIYCSSMPRAESTAQVIAGHLTDAPIEICDDLREGVPTMGFFEQRRKGVPFFKIRQTRKRMNSAYDDIFNPKSIKEDTLLVTHGNLIRYFLCKSIGVDETMWKDFILYQGSLTTLRIGDDKSGKIKTRLISFGETAFMPKNLRSLT